MNNDPNSRDDIICTSALSQKTNNNAEMIMQERNQMCLDNQSLFRPSLILCVSIHNLEMLPAVLGSLEVVTVMYRSSFYTVEEYSCGNTKRELET